VQLQSNKGAKNHGVVLPDAYKEATTSAIVGAAFGAAGQRCMALSAAVFVGGIGPWKDDLIAKARKLNVTPPLPTFIFPARLGTTQRSILLFCLPAAQCTSSGSSL